MLKNIIIIILSLSLLALSACSPFQQASGAASTATTPFTTGISSSIQPSITNQTPTTDATTSSNTTSGLLPTNLAKQFQEAPAAITRQSDGQVVHVNLVKYFGSVSSPNTSISVNNISAKVDNDGQYSVLLDLVKGRNIIQIKTVQGQILIPIV